MADATDSKSVVSDGVSVQVRSPAPKQWNPNILPIGEMFGFVVYMNS